MTVRRSLLTSAVASFVAVALPLAAWADPHADSDPQQGTRLDSFPDEITIRFADEIAEPVSLSVATAEGEVVAESAETVVDGRQIVAEVSDIERSGAFRVSYVVAGTQGQPIAGQVDFEVVDPSEAEAGPGADADAAAEEEEQDTNWRGIVIISSGVLLALAVIVISWRLLGGRPERDDLDEPLP